MKLLPRTNLRLRLGHSGWLTVMMLGALLMAFSASGCIWLAVPSLAYQGYKYEHKQNSSKTADKRNSNSSTSSNSSYE